MMRRQSLLVGCRIGRNYSQDVPNLPPSNSTKLQAMTRQAFVWSVLFAAVAGCSEPSTCRFEAKEGSQHVRFFSIPWVGGGGHPVLLPPNFHQTVHLDGIPILLRQDAKSIIYKKAGPQPKENRDGMVIVEAVVHLELTNVTITSNPPSQTTIYKVVIDEMIEANWRIPKTD